MTHAPLPHILVVDDDDRLRELLRRYLSEHGFVVTVAADAADAQRKMESLVFDLMVLDIMMPGESGLEFTARLREKKDAAIPILLLTAMGEPENRIGGFEAGADDYLPKPFEPRELVMRIRAILRRAPQKQPEAEQQVRFGDYCFDLLRSRLQRGEEPVHLTTQEQEILSLLARRAGRPVSREELAHAGGVSGNERSVDVQINRLRKKIEDTANGRPHHIVTARGSGYMLQVD